MAAGHGTLLPVPPIRASPRTRAMQRHLPSATVLSIALLAGLLAACNRNNEATEAAGAPATAPESAAASAEPSETAAAPAKAPTDLDQLADRVVTQSAGVKEGEVVLITGQSSDGELMEDLAVGVRKAGGFPIVLYDTDRLDKRMFFDVPPKYDTQTDKGDVGADVDGRRRDHPRQRRHRKPVRGRRSRARRRARQGRRGDQPGDPQARRAHHRARQQPLSDVVARRALRHERGRTLEAVLERRQHRLRAGADARRRGQGRARGGR